MSRIRECFKHIKAQKSTALVPFVLAGCPNIEVYPAVLHSLVEAGADIIEVGFPFSDPMADGEVIQQANDRALAAGVGLKQVLDAVTTFRERDEITPLVLMGYANPVEAMGVETFMQRAKQAGVDGVLLVDCPPGVEARFKACADAVAIDFISLIAPNTGDERIRKICDTASGFLYYVSLKGITGSANLDIEQVRERVEVIRSYTQLPIGVGFGIRTQEQVRQITGFADAAIVGSVLVSYLDTDDIEKGVRQATDTLRSMRRAIDSVAESGKKPSVSVHTFEQKEGD